MDPRLPYGSKHQNDMHGATRDSADATGGNTTSLHDAPPPPYESLPGPGEKNEEKGGQGQNKQHAETRAMQHLVQSLGDIDSEVEAYSVAYWSAEDQGKKDPARIWSLQQAAARAIDEAAARIVGEAEKYKDIGSSRTFWHWAAEAVGIFRLANNACGETLHAVASGNVVRSYALNGVTVLAFRLARNAHNLAKDHTKHVDPNKITLEHLQAAADCSGALERVRMMGRYAMDETRCYAAALSHSISQASLQGNATADYSARYRPNPMQVTVAMSLISSLSAKVHAVVQDPTETSSVAARLTKRKTGDRERVLALAVAVTDAPVETFCAYSDKIPPSVRPSIRPDVNASHLSVSASLTRELGQADCYLWDGTPLAKKVMDALYEALEAYGL